MTKKSTHDDFDMDLDNHKQIVNILKKQQCQYITINRLLAFFFFLTKKRHYVNMNLDIIKLAMTK